MPANKAGLGVEWKTLIGGGKVILMIRLLLKHRMPETIVLCKAL